MLTGILGSVPKSNKVNQPQELRSASRHTRQRVQRNRDVNVLVPNIRKVTSGHPGAGQKAWVFLDEIAVSRALKRDRGTAS